MSDLLEMATRAARDAAGEAGARPAATRARILSTVGRRRRRRRSLGAAGALVLLLALVPAARARERIAQALRELVGAAPVSSPQTRGQRAQEPPPEPPAQPEPPVAPPSAAPPPGPVVAPAASRPAPTPKRRAAGAPTPPAAPSVAPADPAEELYRVAHRAHFVDRDPAAALAAWDRYLAAAPRSRFVPEASYNRAITLVRLGRRDEALSALRRFAEAPAGSYRQREAAALVAALQR
jgi:hypothetical protein